MHGPPHHHHHHHPHPGGHPAYPGYPPYPPMYAPMPPYAVPYPGDHEVAADHPGKPPSPLARRPSATAGRAGYVKRARWGAENRIHDHFPDGFPLLRERYFGERRYACSRRYEFNLGSRSFRSKSGGDHAANRLKKLFRHLDRAITINDMRLAEVRPRPSLRIAPKRALRRRSAPS